MFDILIATKVIDLASRYGIDPGGWDCEIDQATGALDFVDRPGGGEQGGRFDAMLAALGCVDGILSAADPHQLCATLDDAIRHAPRVWAR